MKAKTIISLFIIFTSCNPKKLQSNWTYCDSLLEQTFEYENRLNRYEVTLELLKEQNPEAAEIFEKTMSEQTE